MVLSKSSRVGQGTLAPWLGVRCAGWNVGIVSETPDRWRPMGPIPSVLLSFCGIFGKFTNLVDYKKSYAETKTLQIFFLVAFQYGSLLWSLEGSNSWTTIWWNGSWLKCWASWRVGFGTFFCDESWPSGFWMESIPGQQLTLLISKDERVMNLMRPCRIEVWNRILRPLFGLLDVSTLSG